MNREAPDSGDGPWPPVKRVDCGGVVGGSGGGTNQDGYIILVTCVYRYKVPSIIYQRGR